MEIALSVWAVGVFVMALGYDCFGDCTTQQKAALIVFWPICLFAAACFGLHQFWKDTVCGKNRR